MAANLIERSNHRRIGASDLNRGLNLGDVAPPSSSEGRDELKKRTNFMQPPGRPWASEMAGQDG
jgi:hypothetical protein